MFYYEVYIPGTDDVAHIESPWNIQKAIDQKTSGDAPSNLMNIEIPDNQVSLVDLYINASGRDSTSTYGGTYWERIRVKKQDGEIRSMNILDGQDKMDLNFQGHGRIMSFRVTSALSSTSDDVAVQINNLKVWVPSFFDDTDPQLSKNSLAQNAVIRLNNKLQDRGAWRAFVNPSTRPDIFVVKSDIINFDYYTDSEISIVDNISPNKNFRTKENNGDIEVEVENPKAYGIDKHTVDMDLSGSRDPTGGFTVDKDHTGYLFYREKPSEKIAVREGPDYDSKTIISSEQAYRDGRAITAVTDSNDVQHVFYFQKSDGVLRHLDNSGGTWSDEIVFNDTNNNPRIDAVTTSDGNTHIFAAHATNWLRHYSGTTGNWTLQKDDFSSNPGNHAVETNDSDKLALVRIDASGTDILFQKYSGGSWSSSEIVDPNDNGSSDLEIVWSGDKWHIHTLPVSTGRREISHWHGTSGNFSGKTVIYQAPQGAFLTRSVISSHYNGNVSIIWVHGHIEMTQMAYGNPDDGFDIRPFDLNLEYAGKETANVPGNRSTVKFGFLSEEDVGGVYTYQDPHDVNYDYKAVAEIKSAKG